VGQFANGKHATEPAVGRRRWLGSFATAAGLTLARLRFILLLVGVLALVAAWPTLRNHWDKLTGPPPVAAAVSMDTEFWCPMCPGVVSEWPGRCPVCRMTLVRRQKGDMTPLPDGVLARMQLSPYRVHLAGVHTSPVEFLPLAREIVLSGLLQAADDPARLALCADVFEEDVGLVNPGQTVTLASDAFPGQSFPARVAEMAAQLSPTQRGFRLRLDVDNARRELRPGMYASGVLRVPLAELASQRRLALEGWRDRTTASLVASALGSPLGPPAGSGLDALLQAAVHQAALHRGLLPAIPESAVIDTGSRKAVFLEGSPGLFDAVEVRLGRRCGDSYAVLTGLEPGQAVVTAGAFLLDAETRLNPGAAASYFGAGPRAGASAAPAQAVPAPATSSDDQSLIARQKTCPVTGKALGSMGPPCRVVVNGVTVFLCCDGCEPALKENPGKYLSQLPR
jgi:Cu(I)/Ag(I) efflux system membrane fusion protein